MARMNTTADTSNEDSVLKIDVTLESLRDEAEFIMGDKAETFTLTQEQRADLADQLEGAVQAVIETFLWEVLADDES